MRKILSICSFAWLGMAVLLFVTKTLEAGLVACVGALCCIILGELQDLKSCNPVKKKS